MPENLSRKKINNNIKNHEFRGFNSSSAFYGMHLVMDFDTKS
jgi:hypothetical protein